MNSLRGKMVVMQHTVYCDICKEGDKERALYDGKTSTGPWAYMCRKHFRKYGTGLGTGLGQRLVYK